MQRSGHEMLPMSRAIRRKGNKHDKPELAGTDCLTDILKEVRLPMLWLLKQTMA
jgi:hypothetical protein